MNLNLTQAVERLQTRLGQTTTYQLGEQLEEALNCLLARPNADRDPHRLVSNARAQSRKKLRRRRELHAAFESETQAFNSAELPSLMFEVEDFLSRGVAAADRTLLFAAVDGADAEDLAKTLDIPVARVRERLSRSRGRARILWDA